MNGRISREGTTPPKWWTGGHEKVVSSKLGFFFRFKLGTLKNKGKSENNNIPRLNMQAEAAARYSTPIHVKGKRERGEQASRANS